VLKVKFNKSMIAALEAVYSDLEEGMSVDEAVANSSYITLLETYSTDLEDAFDDL
jgi:hypothetical protein